MTAAAMRRVHAVVGGRVQGVGFRATTLDEARRLGLTGWVRNRRDGTVEVVAEGDETVLEAFLAFLRQGPPGARVTGVQLDWQAPEGTLGPFETRNTE